MHCWPILVLGFAATFAHAQSDPGTWYFRIGPSFGQPVLGSEDTRRGTVYAIGHERHEPRLTYNGQVADLLVEAYYLFTKGGGFEDIPVNNMHSYGVLATARYPTKWVRGAQTHIDLAWGFVYNNITTRDLDSHLNSTPSLGVGVSWDRYDLTVRWYHQSNGGLDGHNQGTNQIQYVFTVKF